MEREICESNAATSDENASLGILDIAGHESPDPKYGNDASDIAALKEDFE